MPGMFETQFQQIVLQDEMDRVARMDRAWAAYYGRAPKPLQIKPGQPSDNVAINKVRVVVDKGVSFLFGDDLSLKLADENEARGVDPDAPNPAQVWLDGCLAANKFATWLLKLAMNGGVCGHFFIKIVPNAAGLENQFPRLVIVDPATVQVHWEPDDIEQVSDYCITYNAVDPITGKTQNYRQTVKQQGAGWVCIDQQSDPDSSVWKTTATTLWPHPYPPIVDGQNLPAPNEYWGISDIGDDVLDLNFAASFAISNSQRIIRYHAHPKTVATGVAGPTIQVDVDGVIMLPNPDATLTNLEMQSDLSSTITQYERICEAIHEVARIPAISTGTLDKIGPLSGVALQILYQPLLEKTNTKRRLYGDALVELARRLLDLAGFGPDNIVTISWPELLPGDPLQERQSYLLEDQMGVVSKRTIAERLGLNWETEQQRLKAEDATALARAQMMVPVGPSPTDPMGVQSLPVGPKLQARPDLEGQSNA